MKLESLLDYCQTLPGATRDTKWGNDVVFSVGGKMFCIFGWKDKDLIGMSFKVPDDRFLEYTDRPQFIPAPYLARARWVMATTGDDLDAKEMQAAIRESHHLVLARLPKKVQAEILG